MKKILALICIIALVGLTFGCSVGDPAYINASVNSTDLINQWLSAVSANFTIQGLKGDTGDNGTPGAAGATGAQGPQGTQGSQGLQGIQGPSGDNGTAGVAGPNLVAANTTTDLTGILSGNGTNVGTADSALILSTLGYTPEDTANKGTANGYAPLDASGLVPTDNLGSGTANTSTYLRGDQTWASVSATVDNITEDKIIGGTENWFIKWVSGVAQWVALTSSDITDALGFTPVQTVNATSPLTFSGTTNVTIGISTANASTTGALSYTDWNTFNDKGSGTITSVTASSPLSSTEGTTPNITIATANSTTDGALSSSDWNTFWDKMANTYAAVIAALGFTPVPNTTTVNGHALSGNVTVTNADLGAVPTTTTVNGHALSANVTVTNADLGAVPTTTTVNGHALSANVTVTASDVSALATANVSTVNAAGKVPEADANGTVDGWVSRMVYIKCIADNSTLTTGAGQAYFVIPSEFNGWNLVNVAAAVTVNSTSGLPTFGIFNVTTGYSMCSTNITIDANEGTSYTAVTAAVINASYKTVSTGNQLRIDCNVAGTGTKGEDLILTFRKP